jgi:hypothetical protein
MIFVCSSAMQRKEGLFLPRSKKPERLLRNNRAEQGLEDVLFFYGDKPAGTLKDQFQKIPGRPF